MEPMCGRYSLADPARLRGAFPAIRFPEFSETRIPAMQPRYNIAPTQEVLGVRNDGRDTAELLRWGIRGRVNIRAESVLARRGPVARRCAEFADGFYEWRDRRPYYYTLRSGEPFALAGLWEAQGEAPACDVITCEPNALVAPVHDRMPVILTGPQLELWLEPGPLPQELLQQLLRPMDPAQMEVRQVSRRVNNANYDAADVLETPPDEPRLL